MRMSSRRSSSWFVRFGMGLPTIEAISTSYLLSRDNYLPEYFTSNPLRINILPAHRPISSSQLQSNQVLLNRDQKKCRSISPTFERSRQGNRLSGCPNALFIISLPSPGNKRTPLALDDHIYSLRREKLKQIEALGQPTYRSKYEFTHMVEQILANYTR